MYIRECITTNKATKTKYVTHRLVEAYRVTEGSIAKVRQRLIMHLGTLDLPKSDWPKLAKIGGCVVTEQKTGISDPLFTKRSFWT